MFMPYGSCIEPCVSPIMYLAQFYMMQALRNVYDGRKCMTNTLSVFGMVFTFVLVYLY